MTHISNPDTMGNTDTRTIRINDDAADLPAIAERMAATTARLEADFAEVETKIHRFPRSLRGIVAGGDKQDRYIIPTVVAIGPYHHGAPHLEKMEEVKLAAAHHLCRASGRSTAEVYEKVRAVACAAARRCYDADDPAVAPLRDAEFAAMMFLDGCFLLQYMVAGGGGHVDDDGATAPPVLQNRMTLSTGPSMQKDIFLLENQIPWVVLEALMEFMPVAVHRFVFCMGEKFLPGVPGKGSNPDDDGISGAPPAAKTTTTRGDEESRGASTEQHSPSPPPPHLLGLLRFTQVGCMPEKDKKYTGWQFSTSWSSSAVKLAEVGVVLTPSTESWFGDMRLRYRRHLYGELSLTPVFLSDVTACWLVNMAALEASTAGSGGAGAGGDADDGFVVSSYLSVLATLMDGEEDVKHLRAKRVLYSTLSNKQALGFFKGLAQHLRFGRRYYAVLEEIDSYRRHRPVRNAIHRLFYNSFKAMTIATLFSIVGVLVGIFKTLLDNRKK